MVLTFHRVFGNPRSSVNLTFPLDKYIRMHQTSGISGTPMRWLDTAHSWRWMEDNWQHVFEKAGVTASVIFQNHDPTFFINMPPGSKAYPIINTTTSSDL